MKSYNPDFVQYRFWLLPPSGERKDVTDLIESASLTSTDDGIVDTINISAKNVKIESEWIHTDFYLARRMMIEARDEERDWEEVYRGTFTSWQTNASDFTINSVVSDGNQLILSNDIIAYFPDGTSEGRVRNMLNNVNMPIGIIEGLGGTLNKELVKSDITTKILEYKKESEEKTGIKTVIRNTKGKFEIVKRGTNDQIFVVDSWSSQEGIDIRKIPSDFATVVKVYGAQDGDKVPPLQTTVKGNTSMGSHTKIVYSSDYKNAGEANKAAQNILKEQGIPEATSTVRDHVDIPWVRVGDAIDVAVGTIGGSKNGVQVPIRRYIKALTRDYVNKTMTMELEA